VDLEVVSLVHDQEEASHADRVRELGAQVTVCEVPRWSNRLKALPRLTGSRPLTHLLLDAPGIPSAVQTLTKERPPDVVLAYCSSMTRFAMIPPLASFPLVIDLLDVDSAKWATLATASTGPMRWIYRREAHHLADFERVAAMRAHRTVVVNQREADLLTALAPEAPVSIIPNGVDVAGLKPPASPHDAADLVFCGVMNYGPNVDGVCWFAREIWPLIRARRPDARFSIVGSDPVAKIRQLAASEPGIHVTGTVPDVRSYLWSAAVSVVPLRIARGVQNKVLEGIAAGLPSVITSQVFAGLPAEVHPACRVADTAADFAEQTLSLLALSSRERRAVSAHADLRSLSWERQLEPLYQILLNAAQSRHQAPMHPSS
jgi:sugar transferase (PEP-CTERM/EpsH1 system associated)